VINIIIPVKNQSSTQPGKKNINAKISRIIIPAVFKVSLYLDHILLKGLVIPLYVWSPYAAIKTREEKQAYKVTTQMITQMVISRISLPPNSHQPKIY